MTTIAKCSECDWTQDFEDYSKAKHAAKHHLHDHASIEEVE